MPASGTPAPPAAPLTERDRRQLAALDRTAARGFARFFAGTVLAGLLGGAVLAWALTGPGVRFTLAESVPALAPVERAVGETAFLYLVSMAAFGAAMSALAWRVWAVLMATRAGLRARAGASG